MVSDSISLPSLGSFHLSLTVLYAIGDLLVFRLAQWSGQIPTRFHVSRRTQDTTRYKINFEYGVITLYDIASQLFLLSILSPHCSPTTPVNRFGLFRFRSPLLTESHSFSFPLATEMFHFARYRLNNLFIQLKIHNISIMRVSSFGNLRITASYQLPVAYRRLARPSSPSSP